MGGELRRVAVRLKRVRWLPPPGGDALGRLSAVAREDAMHSTAEGTNGGPNCQSREAAGARFAHWRNATIAGVVCLVFLVAGAGPWLETLHDFMGRSHPFWVREDFTAFYAAGKVVASGLGTHLYEAATMRAAEYAAAGRQVGGTGLLLYFNPPFFAWLFSFLTHLSLQQAYQGWMAFNLLVLAFNCWLLVRISAGLPRCGQLALVIGYLTLYPVTYGLRLGQFSLILQASWATGALLLEQGHDEWSGAAFAPLLIKPEILVPVGLFLVWKGRYRPFVTLLPVMLVAVLVSLFVVGIHGAAGYPGFLVHSIGADGGGVAPNLMVNWTGLIAATAGQGSSFATLLFASALGLLSLGAVAAVTRRSAPSTAPQARLEWLALTTAAMLADPHIYLQDAIIVVPALAGVLSQAASSSRASFGAAMVVGWAIHRLGLYPNQYLHADLAAAFLVGVLVVTLAAAGTRAQRCERGGGWRWPGAGIRRQAAAPACERRAAPAEPAGQRKIRSA